MEDAADNPVKDSHSLKTMPGGDSSHLPTPALSPITEHGTSSPYHEDGETMTMTIGDTPTQRNEGNSENTPLPKTPRMKPDETQELQNGALASPGNDAVDHKAMKLSPAQIFQLTSSPRSIPWRTASPIPEEIPLLNEGDNSLDPAAGASGLGISTPAVSPKDENSKIETGLPLPSVRATPGAVERSRPLNTARSNSSPLIRRKHSAAVLRNPSDVKEHSRSRRPTLVPLKVGDQSDHASGTVKPSPALEPPASSGPAVLPLPPLSLPTYLQLELSSDRPSALYIHRSANSDIPYESSKVKFERLCNFLIVPFQLEQILCFGALACLDAWLYTFTILPLRFFRALIVWTQWWFQFVTNEAKDITSFIYSGLGRLWQRKRQASVIPSRASSVSDTQPLPPPTPDAASARVDVRVDDPAPGVHRPKRKASAMYRHKRSRSIPSALLPNHKADILQGLLIIFTCMILLRFDASRIYHNIRGQSAIKLYVIYNSLEVFDRLFSAIGQDVLECLFSKETLERKPNGRSKVIRPFWLFLIALFYNTVHASALFYQVITLNVAVNSYSNALFTLLMSNQFVEIKGAVFKKLEKENLFQMTCADVVERFQLWLMLLIIALRNIVEVGGFTMNVFGASPTSDFNTTTPSGPSTQYLGILPQAFTLIPKWSGQILGPFLIVLGSEMLVDYLKHAYINKFNSISPTIYSRFLDVLAKDYYSNAFSDQNLMKRLGLPVLPLACLFIRASVQTYHMFVATHMPLPIASTATALALESKAAETNPATTAVLAHIDHIFRRALGRSSFGAGAADGGVGGAFSWWSVDDVIAFATMLVFFLVLYLFLLAFKLVLGMCLLGFARKRYEGMRERERESYDVGSRRVGGLGAVEVDEEKRRWIYEDDAEGLAKLRERDKKAKEKKEMGKGEVRLDTVGRYMMVAKRIW